MRLIDADALYEKYCTLFEGKVDEGEMDRMAYVISSMPTAYSVEKVVERLEEESDFFSGKPMGTLQKTYYCKGIERAIEIIKKEGQI